MSRSGAVWLGPARFGRVRLGMFWRNNMRLGELRSGQARRGLIRCGKMRQGKIGNRPSGRFSFARRYGMRIYQLIDHMVEQKLDDLHVALPARVERFDPATLRGDVVPLVKRRVTNDGEPEPLPPILDVPFWMPKAGPFVLRLPVRRGDVVLVVFSERALDYLLVDGNPQEPRFRRRHALDDAIAIPGLLHQGEGALPSEHGQDVALFDRNTGNKIVLTASGDCIIHVPAGRIY